MVKLTVSERSGLKNLDVFYAGKRFYEPIRIEANDLVLKGSNRADLGRIGVQGEIIETPGHSEDSVSLVLDSGTAFIGDMHLPDLVADDIRELTCQSWKKMFKVNIKTIYPAHGDHFQADVVKRSLGIC